MSLVCAKCGFHSQPNLRYCGMCGTAFAASAPATAPLPATGPLRIPGKTGALGSFSMQQIGVMTGTDLIERFRKAGLEAGGQRRAVTVLFVDLAGYTTLSEQVEAEELFGLIQQMTNVLANAVYKYEGAVDKFTGDGLMALFGAPIAHENHAELAVRSALDMQADIALLSKELYSQLGVELRLHVGLHTGPVIVGSIGTNLMMNYTAIGDTVNMARRLEEASGPNTTIISESVHQQVKNLFTCEPLPPLTLKGIQRPVPAFRVLSDRVEVAVPVGKVGEGLRAPMVGRTQELQQLLHALQRLQHEKMGHLTYITGEAGLGKSRLTAELKAAASQAGLAVMEGFSLTYRRSAAYWLFIDALRGFLGLAPSTPEAEARAKLGQYLKQLMGDLAPDSQPYLEQLLGLKPVDPVIAERMISMEAGRLRQQTFRAVREWLVMEAQRRPVLLILEDLHWADEVSLDLLISLLDTVRQAPLFLCAVSRPQQEGQLPTLLDRANKRLSDRFTRVELTSLPPEDSAHLLDQLMNVPDLPQKIREQILQRAAGIPFYLEEILRMLIDAGVMRQEGVNQWRLTANAEAAIPRVPDTLQDLILARFDRLNEAQRLVLQIASVIGRQFKWPILLAVLEHPARKGVALTAEDLRGALRTLIKREFIVAQEHAPDVDFEFKHALVSDAIYSTLLRRDRSELHLLTGEAIEKVYAINLHEHIEVLARHFGWSHRLDKAFHYAILAGEKASREYANENARRYYTQALNLLPQVKHTVEQKIALHLGMGDVLAFIGEYEAAREQYQIALTVKPAVHPREDALHRSRLERRMSRTYEKQSNHTDALMCLSVALDTLQDTGQPEPTERAQLLGDIAWVHVRGGSFDLAQNLLQEALALVENTPAYEVLGSIYNRLGGIAYMRHNWAQAVAYVRKSIALREAIGDLVELATSLSNLGTLETELGDYENALNTLTRAYELKKRQGQAEGIAISLNNLGLVHIRRGEITEAQAILAEAHEIARQIGYTLLVGHILQSLGEAHFAGGNWVEAQSAFLQALEVFLELKSDETLGIYRLLGETALSQGSLPEAEKWAERLLQQAANMKVSTEQKGEIARFRGQLAAARREWEAAHQCLRESENIFIEARNRLQMGRAAYQLGRLAEAQQDLPHAQAHYREASLIFRSIGATIEAQHAEAQLAGLTKLNGGNGSSH